jgi:hypothetical protein
MSKQHEPLPSIPVYEPARRVLHIIGAPTHAWPEQRVRLRSSAEAEDQQQLLRQVREQEVFWRPRFRNRP